MKRPPTLLGVPVDSAGRPGGNEISPTALRRHGLAAAVGARADRNDLPVRILGPRDPVSGIIGYADVLELTRQLRAQVAQMAAAQELPLLLGGCCSLAMGALAGARDVHARVGVVYIDGHLDLYDGRSSPTGDCADMPFGFLLGQAPPALAQEMGCDRPVAPADAVLLGYRDRAGAQALGSAMPEQFGPDLMHLDDQTLLERGPAAVGSAVAARMEGGCGKFWLHLDFDVLGEASFAAVDYPAPGGLTWPQLVDLLRPLLHCAALAGISLACYNPQLDPGGRCAADVSRYLRQAF